MGYGLRKLNPPRINGKSYLYNRVPKWTPTIAREPVPRSELRVYAAEAACKRLREYLFERGAVDKGREYGWMKYVSDASGLPYGITRGIIHGDITTLTLYAAQRFSDKTGVPLHVLFAADAPKDAR